MPTREQSAVARAGAALGAALELVLPVSCAGCGRWDVPLCARCRALLAAPPARCDAAIPMLDRDGASTLPTWSIGPYAGSLRTLVLAWKNHRRTDVAAPVHVAAAAAGRAWVPHLHALIAVRYGGAAPAGVVSGAAGPEGAAPAGPEGAAPAGPGDAAPAGPEGAAPAGPGGGPAAVPTCLVVV
ncbi:MAG: hypothetical protein ACYC3U_13615, partial [Georgenia sp.]